MQFIEEMLSTARAEVAEQPMLPLSMVNPRFIKITDEIGAGVKAHTFEQMTRYGVAQVIITRATQVPLINESKEEFLVRVFPVRLGFELEYDDLELADANGLNLFTSELSSAREGIEREIDIIGFEGRAQTTLRGISNHPNISILDFEANGDNGGSPSAQWVHKTPEQILADLQKLAMQPAEQTANTVFANRLLLPTSKLNYIATTPYNATGESILTVFLRNQASLPGAGIEDIIGHPTLETAGTGGVGRGVAYNSKSRYNRFHIPKGGDFKDHPMSIQGTTVKVHAQMRTAGTELQRIKEVAYANMT